MPGIDSSRHFIPVRIAVMTVSDTRTMEDDTSGATLVARLEEAGHLLADRVIVKDEVASITAQLARWIANKEIDVVISTGGTGLTGRDVTPEAFHSVYEKEIDGFSALFHRVSFEKIGVSTIQSRATAGVAGGTYLFALPGSTGAVKDGWDEILQYQLDYRYLPCNFVEIMPRLEEHRRK
ncbi:MAG: molybdenum cofactor biosynthesis protein B [Alphaproteobacteria bacterium]|jgi:molybdenum cofactor biosynthesis protein B|nr:molybdenum cofactor biosynthesis protein B [Alphaproteobacteria bacterium]MBO6627958.1 molybdenum cofactor biosynthesis protein B [Alphaproteobacteria bacterium]MDF1625528.1 molybdenum cofactor biosynthesis protein B [Parvibaculaceae bacterium]|tara:strand:+ start:102 stop:641 length:540 start_codon:yes stop_codon:yes gene_type:complete